MNTITGKFMPARGKVAIELDKFSTQTDAGIIHNALTPAHYQSGIVASIGPPDIDKKGNEMRIDYEEGDRVLLTKTSNMWAIGEYCIANQHGDIWAIIDKDVKLG